MARAQGNTIIIGGRVSYYFIDYVVAAQNEDGNYSTISWNCQYYFDRCDAQLDNGVANLAGTRWYNGGRVYNFTANYSVHAVYIAGGSFDVGHDSNGNCLLNVNGGIDVYQSGRSSTNQDTWLPQLYQGIAYNWISFSNVTDVGFTVTVNVNRTANLLQLNVNGTGFVTYYSGNYGQVSVNVGGSLASGVTHSVVCRTRRASNGWITDNQQFVATLGQNNFFGTEGF